MEASRLATRVCIPAISVRSSPLKLAISVRVPSISTRTAAMSLWVAMKSILVSMRAMLVSTRAMCSLSSEIGSLLALVAACSYKPGEFPPSP